jgi:ComF family protein
MRSRATAPSRSVCRVPELANGLGQGARLAVRATIDFLLPPTCLTCDAPVDAPGRFCPDCFRATGFVTEPCCARCGVPFAHRGQAGLVGLCPGCLDRPPDFDCARAALRYDTQARRIVLPFKHADRVEIARALAPLMARAGAQLLERADVLVPVPLHRRRLFSRRYNQAALLAQALSRFSGIPAVLDALRRVRATAALGEKSAAARVAEVVGAFVVHSGRKARVAGRRVLLVDDVMTSGATANACAAALRAAGASGVDVLLAARVPDPRLAR